MRRREFTTLLGAAAIWPLAAHAQQPAKIRRIGYLDYGAGMLPGGGFAPFHDTYRRKPFLDGLREGGWVEGQNVTIERRFAAGQANRLPALAAELVALNVDVMLAAATPAAKAAQSATSRIAIVMADPGDAVQDRKSTRLNSSHTEIYTLSLHDALPISQRRRDAGGGHPGSQGCAERDQQDRHRDGGPGRRGARSEEHTSELQSHRDLHSFPTRRSSDLSTST